MANYPETITEDVTTGDVDNNGVLTSYPVVTETLSPAAVIEEIKKVLLSTSDSIAVADAYAYVHHLQFDAIEAILAESTATNNITGVLALTESISAEDFIYRVFKEALNESVAVADAYAYVQAYAQFVTEVINVVDVYGISANYKKAILEALSILDEIIMIRPLIVSESLTASDVISFVYNQVEALVEAIAVADSVSEKYTLGFIVSEGIDLGDSSNPSQQCRAIITEVIRVNGLLTGVANLGDSKYTFVMNTHTKGVSEYTNYNFNSLSGNLAATDSAIYEIGGTQDAGASIDAYIRTGLIDFGTSLEKQVPYAYLGISKSGRMMMKVVTDFRGNRKEHWYEATSRAVDATDNVRVKFGRGLQSRYWQFEITNIAGSDFELDSIELMPLILKRRI